MEEQAERVESELDAETLVHHVKVALEGQPSDEYWDTVLLQTLQDRLQFYETFHNHETFSVQEFIDFYKDQEWVKLAEFINLLSAQPINVLETWKSLDASTKMKMTNLAKNMWDQQQRDSTVSKQIEIVLKRIEQSQIQK